MSILKGEDYLKKEPDHDVELKLQKVQGLRSELNSRLPDFVLAPQTSCTRMLST